MFVVYTSRDEVIVTTPEQEPEMLKEFEFITSIEEFEKAEDFQKRSGRMTVDLVDEIESKGYSLPEDEQDAFFAHLDQRDGDFDYEREEIDEVAATIRVAIHLDIW